MPTALVAGAGLFALDRGLTPWFAGDLKRLVETSESIAQNFQQQLCQNMGRELRLMASDLDRANTGGFYFGNRDGFQQFMNNRAEALGFPRAVVFKRDGSLVMQAEVEHRTFSVPQPAEEDYQYAATDELPCLFTRESLGGLIALKSFGPGTFLMVARAVDPRAIEFPEVSRAGVQQYQQLDERRNATQLGIALVFALITLISMLGAVLLGLAMPHASWTPCAADDGDDQVSAGNLYVQVPVAKMGEDLGQLGSTFNNMTSALREQHNSLSAANELIDQRRLFMEAMLSGIPEGVFGVDENGLITLINPAARGILGLGSIDPTGKRAAELLPEIVSMMDEVRQNPQRLVQREFPVRRRGVERILSARAVSDASGGQIVTLDDITSLVTRRSARLPGPMWRGASRMRSRTR